MLPRASFWQRAAAWSLDATLLALPTLLLSWPSIDAGRSSLRAAGPALLAGAGTLTAATQGGRDPVATPPLPDAAGLLQAGAALEAAIWQLLLPPLLVFALLGGLYHVVAECSRWRGSIGKHCLGLQVGDARGAALHWPHAAWRYLAGALSWLTLNVGHAMALGPGHRALHDRVSHSRVERRGDARLPAWARAWLWLQALAWLLATLWLLMRVYGALRATLEQAGL